MSFIGNTPTQQAFTPAVDVFSGNGSTTAFTLSRPVASVAQVQAFIENVPQSPVDAFTVSGNTITFTSAPPSGSSNIYVRYTSPITQVIQPGQATVNTAQLVDLAVTPAKMANGGAEFASNNLLINGSFDVASRSPTVTDWGSFGYTLDNVQIGYDGTPPSGRTVTQQTFAMGQTDILEGDPKFYLQYVFPNCGTPTNYFRFPVESVRTLAGKQATFSFWARVPSGTMTIGVAIAQEFGSGGSPSAGVYPAQTNYTVTTTWQKFIYTTTLSSIAGKTIGTNNNDMIWPAIWLPTNAAGTIQLANIKLEGGGVATPFQRRPIQVERALCQRFYFRISSVGSGWNYCKYGNGFAQSAVNFNLQIPFPVTMRAAPYAIDTAAASNFNVWDGVGNYTLSSITIDQMNPQCAGLICATTGMTPYRPGAVQSLNNQNSYIGFSAEL